jgi:hypothetical protein
MNGVVDVNELMREGHPFIAETEVALLERMQQRVRALDRPARILELGSGSGVLTRQLCDRFPEAEIIAHEEMDDLRGLALKRLDGRNVTFHTRPLRSWQEPVDIVFSAGTHHHMPHDYFEHVRHLISPNGVYVLGDELCPEYCRGAHALRLARAEVLRFAGGYLLTSNTEIEAFDRDGTVPEHARELENLRRATLWRWYRFVVDFAVERGHFEVAASELGSARDDLITGSDAEHKFSASIVERQVALAGLRTLTKQIIGMHEPADRQSFFVYELGLA